MEKTNAIILELIKKRNTMVENVEFGKYYMLEIGETTTEDEIKLLEKASGFMPETIKLFYKEIGSIGHIRDEVICYQFIIPPVKELIANLSLNDEWYKLHSTGIIDIIKFDWANDRPEFDDFMKKDDVKYLNENYKCIGWYRGSWGREEACYVYFDKKGKFGVIRYHQDDFDDLVQKFLNPLLSASQATFSIDEVFQYSFHQVEKELKENLTLN